MASERFQALWVEATANNRFQQSVVERHVNDLPDHPLLVEVHYSSLNYKDALSAAGNPGVTREYPHTPGIDAAGVVLDDQSGRFQPGDEVIVSGYDLGMNTPGGLAQRIRVPSEWAVALPDNLSLAESMMIGTAGFTAGLCIGKLQHMGARPEDGSVLVSGATGGVGSFSVALLNQLGYTVTAVTGKLEQSEWLVSLGASQVVERSSLMEVSKKPMVKPQWAHAVDPVGGDMLVNIIKSLQYGGSVANCGMAGSPKLEHLTVFPFILRNVNLLGVDCVELPLSQKAANWQRLAGELKLPNLSALSETITLAQVPEYLTRILNGHAIGRYVVDLRA